MSTFDNFMYELMWNLHLGCDYEPVRHSKLKSNDRQTSLWERHLNWQQCVRIQMSL